jgi:hypothetical protein
MLKDLLYNYMSYKVTQINDLEQSDELITTFLLVDDAGIMPDIRIDKVFKVTENIEKRINNQKIIDCMFYENEYLNSIE